MDDTYFMREALDAGREVEGRTGDNPPVGAVIVKEDNVVARGATQPPGGPHAEVMAISAAEEAGHQLKDCVFYITLEPCTFQGRTPPCSSLLVEKRPLRVVIGIPDPHPLVSGMGIADLKKEGIEVVEGVLAEEISAFLAPWLNRHSK